MHLSLPETRYDIYALMEVNSKQALCAMSMPKCENPVGLVLLAQTGKLLHLGNIIGLCYSYCMATLTLQSSI